MERTRTWRSAEPAGWRVRVLDDGGTRLLGAGVLLPGGSVLTCAHVVEAALGHGRSPQPPEGSVRLEFPSAAPGDSVRAHVAVDGWLRTPPAGDLAVLHPAETLPQGVQPAPVGAAAPDGAEVLVYGHPEHAPDGVWARARTVGAGGPGARWWQLDGADPVGARIEPGFSGGGVWDPGRGRVTGVVAAALETEYGPAADGRARVAWMIPLSLLAGTPYAPTETGTGAGTGTGAVTGTGTRAGAVTGTGVPEGVAGPDAVWAVVDALLAVSVAGADGGTELLVLLPEHIRWGVRRAAVPRLQILYLVQRCGDFADGPAALVHAVRRVEGDTLPVRQFVARAEQLWPDRLVGP